MPGPDAALDTAADPFRSHFHREPDPGNPHDLACLRQIDLFIERHGRAPDTGTRADLIALQKIEVDTHPEVSDSLAESLSRRASEHEGLNALEVEMMKHPAAEMPLEHRFTPGLYTRQILHPAGVLSATKIHKTEHQFIVSQGRALVSTGDGQWHEIQAPYHGITKPGTRRVIYALEDMVLTTMHPTSKTDLGEIEEDLIYKHDAHRAGLIQPPPAAMLGDAL